jgi:hypothetical protein
VRGSAYVRLSIETEDRRCVPVRSIHVFGTSQLTTNQMSTLTATHGLNDHALRTSQTACSLQYLERCDGEKRKSKGVCAVNLFALIFFLFFLSLFYCFADACRSHRMKSFPTKLHCPSLEKSDVGKRPTLLESRNKKRESWVSWIAKTLKPESKKSTIKNYFCGAFFSHIAQHRLIF